MTLQASGPISYSQIINEFGGNRGSLGNYRVNQSVGGVNWPLDEGVPTSGQISFNNFYSKSKNIIVDCYSAGGIRVDAGVRGRTVIGGGGDGTSFTGARVVIYVNSVFTTTAGGATNKCALRTGGFNTASKMDVILGNSAQIYGGGGAGGNGGNAGERNANAGNAGQTGTSALGLQRFVESVVLSPGSLIRAGAGGGGGGGGAAGEIGSGRSQEYGAGGGGAGGSGIPAGPGGSQGNDSEGEDREATNGGGGGNTNGGAGGLGATGGQRENKADGGGGGGGGSWGGSGGSGGEAGQGEGFDNGEAHDGNPGGYPGLSETGEDNRIPIANGQGGGGGKGGARGTGQDEGQGGAGGASGYAIASNSNIGFLGGGTVQGPIGQIGVG